MDTIYFYNQNNDEAEDTLFDIDHRIITFIGETTWIRDYSNINIDKLFKGEFRNIHNKYGDSSDANDFPHERYNELIELQRVRDEILQTQFKPKTFEEIVDFLIWLVEYQVKSKTYEELVEFVKSQLKLMRRMSKPKVQ